jgi:hypothetical protein
MLSAGKAGKDAMTVDVMRVDAMTVNAAEVRNNFGKYPEPASAG